MSTFIYFIANILLNKAQASVAEAFGNIIIITASEDTVYSTDAAAIAAHYNSILGSACTVTKAKIKAVSNDDLTEREAFYHGKNATSNRAKYRIMLTIKK